MKILILISCLVAVAMAQGPIERPTMVDALQQAQLELTWGHEFTELFILQNRERLSDYLERIELRILDDFMDAYAEIKNIGLETRRIMEEDFAEPSFCKDNIRRRWDLQLTRYGQKLSQCLGIADGYLKQFTSILNELHVESRQYSNVIPNASIHTLSELLIFDSRDNLPMYINDRYRDLVFRTLARYDEFEEFVDGISVDFDTLVNNYTACYRELPSQFQEESTADLQRIAECYSD